MSIFHKDMDFIISSAQLRGARNYLGYTLVEMAEELSVTKATLSNYEKKEGYDIPVQKNRMLIRFFQKKGIVFIPGGTFVKVSETKEVQVLKGYFAIKQVFDDIYDLYVMNPNAECCVFGLKEGVYLNKLGYLSEHIAKMSAVVKTKMKAIVSEKYDSNKQSLPYCEYRQKDSGIYFDDEISTYVFDGKTVVVDFENLEAQYMNNPVIASAVKKMFDVTWALAL